MTRLLEYGFEDSQTLASHSQINFYRKGTKPFSPIFDCQEWQSQYVLNKCQCRITACELE